jgi:hypothetical protein
VCRPCKRRTDKRSTKERYDKNPERKRAAMRKYQRNTRLNNRALYLWRRARERATAKGLKFTITVDDIVIPETCPALGVRFTKSGMHSPSLDRLIPAFSYTPENIRVISRRANLIKNDATAAELLSIAAWMKSEGLS